MSDDLLDKANALMRRRNAAQAIRTTDASARNATNTNTAPSSTEPPMSDEDFPVLTDVVHVSPDSAASVDTSPPSADIAAQIEAAVRERLDHLRLEQQAELSREIEAWLNMQMPQLVSRAMDGLTDHIVELIAHRVRDELLPRLREISPNKNNWQE